jgi:F-type H+-transporting ATPase subunit delta
MSEAFALRYAQALYDCGREDAALLERIGFELEKFAEIAAGYPDLASYFDSPLVELKRRQQFLASIAKEMEISDEVHGLLRAVIKRNRFSHLSEIVKAYKEVLETEEEGAEAIIYSVRSLSDHEHSMIKQRLETLSGKHLTINVKVDQSLIGGVRAEIGHKIYDSTVRNSLNLLRKQMAKGV